MAAVFAWVRMDSRVHAVGTIYEFDDVRVEPLSHRLYKGDSEVTVEPKVYSVLLEFLRRPGQIITHDELLDAVWGHQHVTAAALARVVSRLRKQLGDPPDCPRYIQTVHTLGYRFVAPVSQSEQNGVAHPPRAAELAPESSVAVAPSGLEKPAPDARHARTSPARNVGRPLLLASMLAAVALGAAGFWVLRTGGAPKPIAPATVAVLPLAAPTGDSELSAAAAGFSDSLIEALSREPALRVGGRASALAIGPAGAANPERTAQMLGVDNLVFGQIAAHDAELDLRLELWHRGHAAPQVLLDQRVPRTQLFRALTRAADGVQASLSHASAPRPEEPAVLSARDLYLLGRAQWQEQTQPSLQRALEYFQRAVAADPAYALGWCGLTDTYVRLQPGALSEAQLLDRARSALAQAKSLAPESADTFVSEGLFYENQPGHRADALVAFKQALDREPHHPLALLRYGNTLRYAGRVRDAIEWHGRALAFDPLNVRLHNELAADYVMAGDDTLANRQIARVFELDPGNADVHGRVGFMHERNGRLADAAMEFSEKIGRKPAPEFWEYFDLARIYLRAGATDLAEQALSVSAKTASRDWLYQLAAVRMAQGRLAGALDLVAAACPPPKIIDRCTDQQARLLALLDRRDEARALYDSLFSDSLRNGEQPIAFWYEEFYWHQFAAWLALLPPGSSERSRGIAYWGSQIQRLEDNGVKCPSVSYQRASQAALSGDPDAARRHLDAAIASGWVDAAALDRDLEWKPYARADWMLDIRTRIATLAAAERSRLPANMGKLSAR
jgi:DNA-binding winged helix-turn-helix (wHTH) protein/tetratricopeptide (TPR) repeat protein